MAQCVKCLPVEHEGQRPQNPYNSQMGSRSGWDFYAFEACIIYRASSRIARTTWRAPVSKTKQKITEKFNGRGILIV